MFSRIVFAAEFVCRERDVDKGATKEGATGDDIDLEGLGSL